MVKRAGIDINKIEREFIRDIRGAEDWVIERRKFFIKLFGVIAFFLLAILISIYAK